MLDGFCKSDAKQLSISIISPDRLWALQANFVFANGAELVDSSGWRSFASESWGSSQAGSFMCNLESSPDVKSCEIDLEPRFLPSGLTSEGAIILNEGEGVPATTDRQFHWVVDSSWVEALSSFSQHWWSLLLLLLDGTRSGFIIKSIESTDSIFMISLYSYGHWSSTSCSCDTDSSVQSDISRSYPRSRTSFSAEWVYDSWSMISSNGLPKKLSTDLCFLCDLELDTAIGFLLLLIIGTSVESIFINPFEDK